MKRPSLDDSAFYAPRPSVDHGPLWEVLPQSVASGGSPDGAEKSKGAQQEQCAAVLSKLAIKGCMPGSRRFLSREDLSALTGIDEESLCARLGPSGPLMTMKDIQREKGVCVSKAGVRVIGYQLAPRGVDVLRVAVGPGIDVLNRAWRNP